MTSQMQALPEVETWIEQDAVRAVPASMYWNDIDLERQKAFWDPERLSEYLDATSLKAALHDALALARHLERGVTGTGIDLAAGACWTTAIVSRLPAVDCIYAVDISNHRLRELAPRICGHFGAVSSKVRRVLGSFYDIRLPDRSLDFCMMSQGFHHADDPERLITELRRVMKPGAPLLLAGETPVYPSTLLIARLKNLVKRVCPAAWYTTPPIGVWPLFEALFPPDPIAGDRTYRIREYRHFFAEGFALSARRSRRYTAFVAVRNDF